MSSDSRRDWPSLALTTLTTTIGMQTLRLLLPLIVYAYGERPGISSVDLGIYAFATFLGTALAGVAWAALKPRWTLALTAGGLGLLRLAAQFAPSTVVDLALMTAGTVLFLMYLPVAVGVARGRGQAGGADLALGMMLGLALDTTLHGAWRTYDLAWQTDIGSHIVVVALVAAQLAALARSLPPADSIPGPEARLGASLALIALGPFLFLEMGQFQNIARLAALIEVDQPARPQASAFAIVVIANALAVAMVLWIAAYERPAWGRGWPASIVVGALLVVCVSLTPAQPLGTTSWLGLFNAVGVIVGGVLAATMLTLILMRLTEGGEGPRLWRSTLGAFLGMMLFVILSFGYYFGYDLRVPYDNGILPPIGGAGLALIAILAARKLSPNPRQPIDWRPAYAALALVVLPLALAALTPRPGFEEGQGGQLRIVDYNLHQGFDVDGRLGMEALATVMDENDADIVVLQEVSRGWVINGSLDMLGWLSHRLDMPYVFAPAADPVWGNAILSRYPIESVERGALPRGPVAMKRGYVQVRIDYGAAEPVTIIGTHLHHLEGDTAVRVPQVETVLGVWDGAERTLIMGDMNARPGEADVTQFSEAGLLDVYSETGVEDSLTYISSGPYELIDWIFASPDVSFVDFAIPGTTASDHLPLVTTVELP